MKFSSGLYSPEHFIGLKTGPQVPV